jgi:hypothetical protein
MQPSRRRKRWSAREPGGSVGEAGEQQTEMRKLVVIVEERDECDVEGWLWQLTDECDVVKLPQQQLKQLTASEMKLEQIVEF